MKRLGKYVIVYFWIISMRTDSNIKVIIHVISTLNIFSIFTNVCKMFVIRIFSDVNQYISVKFSIVSRQLIFCGLNIVLNDKITSWHSLKAAHFIRRWVTKTAKDYQILSVNVLINIPLLDRTDPIVLFSSSCQLLQGTILVILNLNLMTSSRSFNR